MLDQVLAFAGDNILLTSTVVGLVAIGLLEHRTILGWLGHRASRASPSSTGAMGAGGGTGSLATVPRWGARLIGAVPALVRSSGASALRPGVPSVPTPTRPSLPNVDGLVSSLTRPFGWLWAGLRRLATSARGVFPGIAGATVGAASSTAAWMRHDAVRHVAVVAGYLVAGTALGWFAAPLLPI